MGGTGRKAAASVVALIVLAAFRSLPAAQIPFEQAIKDLTSPDSATRLRTVQLLRDTAYPEAAVPLAALVNDPIDQIQFEAIAAELNIFRVEKALRKFPTTEEVFSAGPLAIGPLPVPGEVLTALVTAIRDENTRVGLDALYAFGALAPNAPRAVQRDALRTAGPQLAASSGARDVAVRSAAVRVFGRMFDARTRSEPIDNTAGDALVAALNDKDRGVRVAALDALGATRYDRAVQALTELAAFHGKGNDADAALDALARIASPSSAPLFVRHLSAKEPASRGIAVEGLARLGDPAQLAVIRSTLAGERSEPVLLAMAFASTLLSNASIDPLGEALVRPRLRDLARRYLVEIAPGRSSLFTRHVQDPDARMRLAVTDVLALADDPAALPLVEPLARDRDPLVAAAADRAVARLRAARSR